MDVDVQNDAAVSDRNFYTGALPGRPRSSSVPGQNKPHFNVGYVFSSEMLKHFSLQPEGHPEAPERILTIWNLLVQHGYDKKMLNIPIRAVKREEALLVHTEDHWGKVLALQLLTDEQIFDSAAYYEQLSLYVMQGTTRAALFSCGGVIQACLAVATGQLSKTLAIVRPPGHHAEPDEHMGFCLLNNVAVAAKVVQQTTPLKKILILDWDVHHGNGTQRAFQDDPSVLYISIHRYDNGEFYPTGPYGCMESCGDGAGLGYSVNIPWPGEGMGDADYILAFQKIVMPIAIEFAPELVIISAGFDAALGDELGECEVSPAGYAHMTHMLAGLAGGKMVVALEGGYNVDAIAKSTLAVTSVLLGEAPEELPRMVASEIGAETIWFVAKEQSKYWKNVDPKSCEPRDDVEPISFTISEVLKAHRQYYMYTQHDMMEIPIMEQEMEERFNAQVMCTSNLFQSKTVVLFAHEFGNLRLELDAYSKCDIHAQRSYLIDCSKEIVSWIKLSGYSLVDVNLLPKPLAPPAARSKAPVDLVAKRLLIYLWDNYIQLCGATKAIFIGLGAGCQPLVKLLEERQVGVMRMVNGIIQVVGHSLDPTAPRQSEEELRAWYFKHSMIVIPDDHRITGSNPLQKQKSTVRRHGVVHTLAESKTEKLIMVALPTMKLFIEQKLDEPGDDTMPQSEG